MTTQQEKVLKPKLGLLELVLQPQIGGEVIEASLSMGMPSPGLMPPSPPRPAYRKVITLGVLPQQAA